MSDIRERIATNQQTHKANLEFNPAEALEKYRIDPQAEIVEDPVLLAINGATIATLGNFSLLIGKAKSRKTFTVGGLTAAAASGLCSITGIVGTIRTGADRIIYFDTEQSPFHAQRSLRRICRQIGNYTPPNLMAYGLRPQTPSERRKTIDYAINNTPGLAMVVIDGISDLLSRGINDEEEAIGLIVDLLRWTQVYRIHIITVLHQNKGDLNARGHIGTYLQNKAESVFSVTKDLKYKDVSIVEPIFCRDKDFQPFGFTINEEGLPILTDVFQPASTKKTDEEKSRFEFVFKDNRKINNSLLVERYMDASRLGKSSANKHIAAALTSGIIAKDEQGFYYYPQWEEPDPEIPF